MEDPKPKPECPNCQGTGEPQTRWDYESGGYVVTGIMPCPICYADFEKVHLFTEAFLLEYSGKQSLEVSAEDQDLAFLGEDGQKYRRLLTWLWTHPPATGQDRNGIPLGAKKTKPKTFSQLFGHERNLKPRIPKLEYEGKRIIPWFAADVKPLLEAWTKIVKPVRKNPPLPILQYVRVSPRLDGIDLAYTDLADWHEGYSPACVFSNRIMLLPARLIQKLLKECNKKGAVAFGLDPWEEEEFLSIIVRHENACWRIPLMNIDMYPVRTWPEAQEEEREVA